MGYGTFDAFQEWEDQRCQNKKVFESYDQQKRRVYSLSHFLRFEGVLLLFEEKGLKASKFWEITEIFSLL